MAIDSVTCPPWVRGQGRAPAERAMRPVGIGRKTWLLSGSDAGAKLSPAP
ncbi:hypothetical protein EBL87_19985 [Cereibacter sphaeroides]|nr:hypothetical protein EBL87_19985 [Cereibacter sphaeroides]AZB70813.1 hypothetical protein EBL86_20930 [Cereibacter sphaeroides]